MTILELLSSPVGVWTLSAAVGFLVCSGAAGSAAGDLIDLGDISNGRRKLAWSNIWDEVTRALILLSWFVMGLIYIMADQEPRQSSVAWVIVAGNVALTVNSIRRTLVRAYIRKSGREVVVGDEETQDQREDRQFGEQRRNLETQHMEENGG